ncbi:MAG: hypothetical protein Q9195_002250 [Heterodermia aff. obscurata]
MSCLFHRIRRRPPHQACIAGSPSRLAGSIRCPTFRRHFADTRQQESSKASSSHQSLPVEEQLSELLSKAKSLTQSTAIPSEESSKEALDSCKRLAAILVGVETDPKADSYSPTSSLLDLEELRKRFGSPTSNLSRATRNRIAEEVSKTALDIISSPPVFITPSLLATYVDTQALLNRPEAVPPAFILYASKPLPRPGTTPTEYIASNPKKASSAVPISIASTALDAAIDAKNLPVCFDIINTTVCAPAFRRNKFVRRALLPCIGAAMVPVAAYTAASQWSIWQDTMDNDLAWNIMFGGLLAYVGFTAGIGFVAVTTSNDQMDRITWAIGTPLRERWLREEERAFVDRVAGAWGFQEPWKRGQEEGLDWQQIYEWAGLRGMVLDKVGLMEGME